MVKRPQLRMTKEYSLPTQVHMQGSMCLKVFVEGRTEHVVEMVALEDHIQEVVVLDGLDPACVYTFMCVEIKTNTETVALRMFQKVEKMLVPQARFFNFCRG